MMTSAALFNKLQANAVLVDLVAARIYPGRGGQDETQPYIIWQRIASRPSTTHGEKTGNETFLVQFSCFAPDYEACEAVALALKDALDNETLSTGDTCIYQNWRDAGMEPAIDLHRIDVDFLI
jgi:hypothetical protein